MLGENWIVEEQMARRHWTKCKCGAKLRIKSGEKVCYICRNKERKDGG